MPSPTGARPRQEHRKMSDEPPACGERSSPKHVPEVADDGPARLRGADDRQPLVAERQLETASRTSSRPPPIRAHRHLIIPRTMSAPQPAASATPVKRHFSRGRGMPGRSGRLRRAIPAGVARRPSLPRSRAARRRMVVSPRGRSSRGRSIRGRSDRVHCRLEFGLGSGNHGVTFVTTQQSGRVQPARGP